MRAVEQVAAIAELTSPVISSRVHWFRTLEASRILIVLSHFAGAIVKEQHAANILRCPGTGICKSLWRRSQRYGSTSRYRTYTITEDICSPLGGPRSVPLFQLSR